MSWLVERAAAVNTNFLKLANPSNTDGSLTNFVASIINIMLFVAGAAAVIYLIYSGVLYISAAGNPDAAKKGQQGIINAIIGIVIIVLAFFIAQAVAGYAFNTGNNVTNEVTLFLRSFTG